MRMPDRTGRWNAWKYSERPETGVLRSYLVHCPGAHAVFSWWLVSLIHLRPIEGQPAAKLRYPDAEYELSTVPLDSSSVLPDVDGVEPLRLFSPDIVEQFHGVKDEEALAILEGMIGMICETSISPDGDFRRQWRRIVWDTVQVLTGGIVQGCA